MRVVQVVPTLAVGGLERIATTLTRGLVRQGDDVAVCTRGDYGLPGFADDMRRLGVPIYPITRPRPRPWPLVAAARGIAPVLRRHRPEVIHAHNPAAAIASALARTVAGTRDAAIVTTYHGLTPSRTGQAMRAIAASSELAIGIGPTATEELARAGFPRDRLVTVPNATDALVTRPAGDVRRELGLEGMEIVTTVGRYTPEKNQALLLEALALLAAGRPLVRGLLVGIGPLEAELRERASSLGLSSRVQLTGPRMDAIDLVAASDVLALTSLWEGLGLTLIEAMTVGTPVVATAVGGVVDVVEHDSSGLLVPSGDAPALAAAIGRILDDSAVRERLVANARTRATTVFSVDAMVDGYRAAYESAIRRRRSRSMLRRSGARRSK